MNKDLLRKVQLAQLEIAREIKRVCDDSGIQYFLDSGSLLGAVRHQGFIPWDDDMDFGMLAEEYERFLQIAPEKLGKEYILQSWDTDSGYPFAFSKILKLGTEFVEDVFEQGTKRNELYVDIFPYYPFPADQRVRRKQKAAIQVYKHILMVQSGMTPWVRPEGLLGKMKVWAMYAPFILASKLVGREWVKEKYTAALRLSRVGNQAGYFPTDEKYGRKVIPAACFDSYIELPFENTAFKAPGGYERYLTESYGDYMKLPPEDQRENHHRIVRVKL